VSATDQQALDRNLEALAQYLETKTFTEKTRECRYLQDLAYTLSERRSKFRWTAVISASSISGLITRIRDRDVQRANIGLQGKNSVDSVFDDRDDSFGQVNNSAGTHTGPRVESLKNFDFASIHSEA
jgi:acyl transferase domain-containing protein